MHHGRWRSRTLTVQQFQEPGKRGVQGINVSPLLIGPVPQDEVDQEAFEEADAQAQACYLRGAQAFEDRP